jgi:hypothetical protein
MTTLAALPAFASELPESSADRVEQELAAPHADTQPLLLAIVVLDRDGKHRWIGAQTALSAAGYCKPRRQLIDPLAGRRIHEDSATIAVPAHPVLGAHHPELAAEMVRT